MHRLLSLMKELIYVNLSLKRDKVMKKYIRDEIMEIGKNYKLKEFNCYDFYSQ